MNTIYKVVTESSEDISFTKQTFSFKIDTSFLYKIKRTI